MEEVAPAQEVVAHERTITLRGAVFIGIGSMVGAGIFALFGQAGAIAGSAVWLSFLAAGIIALLQGYSFAKLGARYPSAGGLFTWIQQGYGNGVFSGGIIMLGYFSVVITSAMVAASFGSYATELFLGSDAAPIWPKIFTTAVVIGLTIVNMVGAEAVTRAQTVVVSIVIVVLCGFALAMLTQMNTSLLAPSTYPPARYILASVALAFFSYLGFGVLAFTGGDIQEPEKNLPRAMYISLGFTMALYIALALGVFGTLTVDQVIEHADTALAVAALPIFGQAGFTLISVAALFATTGSVNSMLYASIGATYTMARDGQLPPRFGLKNRRGGTQGLVISALLTVFLAILFDLGAIASLGSAVSLAVFALITVAHLRMVDETKASKPVLYLALITTSVAILLFCWYTAVTDPRLFAILVVTVILAWVFEWFLARSASKPGASGRPAEVDMAREQLEQRELARSTDLETSPTPSGIPVEEDSTDQSELLACLSKLGKALIAAGSSVGTVENTLTQVASVYRVKCEIIALPNILMVKLDQPPHRIIDIAVQRLTQLNLDQMSELVELIDKLLRRSIQPRMVTEQVDRILAKPHRFNSPTIVAGYLLSCIRLTLLFRPEPLALLVTGAAGIFVGAMIILFERWPRFNLLLPIIAAFVVSTWIFNLTRMGLILGPTNLLIAPLITFLPGAVLTTGMIELASMQIISGSARLMCGGATLFLLFIGIAAGLSLSGLPNVYVYTPEATAFPWWAPFLGTLLFAAGTFIRLSGANRDLIWILLVLYIAMLSQSLGERWLSPYFGAFLGATLMTLSSEIIARSPQRTPAHVSQLLAFWFLVPGARGLLGVTSILGQDFQSAAIGIGQMVGLIGAIAVGVLLGTLLVSPHKFTPVTAHAGRIEDGTA